MFFKVIKIEQLQYNIIYIIKNNLLNLNSVLIVKISLRKLIVMINCKVPGSNWSSNLIVNPIKLTLYGVI